MLNPISPPGVRYNAEKKQVGKYYTTPIYRYGLGVHPYLGVKAGQGPCPRRDSLAGGPWAPTVPAPSPPQQTHT